MSNGLFGGIVSSVCGADLLRTGARGRRMSSATEQSRLLYELHVVESIIDIDIAICPAKCGLTRLFCSGKCVPCMRTTR